MYTCGQRCAEMLYIYYAIAEFFQIQLFSHVFVYACSYVFGKCLTRFMMCPKCLIL